MFLFIYLFTYFLMGGISSSNISFVVLKGFLHDYVVPHDLNFQLQS